MGRRYTSLAMEEEAAEAAATDRHATPAAVPGITPIDTRIGGRELVTSAYLLDATEPALVETGPRTSLEAVTVGLSRLGIEQADLAHVIVTHIHLDHAGGVGALSQRFPRARIWVHDRGAPHLADPDKLVASVARIYGRERMLELFGPVVPTDRGRIQAIGEGDVIDLGGRRVDVLYTPGHASHHVALADRQTGGVFTGDALGIHLPDVRVLRPATPPPDVDVEASIASIDRILGLAPSVLLFSHYGPVEDVEELCELARRRLTRWAEVVRGALPQGREQTAEDLDRIAEILDDATRGEFDEAPPDVDRASARERYELLATMRINAEGLVRYWRKRDQATGAPAPSPT